MPLLLTMGDIARRFGCQPWQVRRIYERGILPPAERVGQNRVVRAEDVPSVEAALRSAGYLNTKTPGGSLGDPLTSKPGVQMIGCPSTKGPPEALVTPPGVHVSVRSAANGPVVVKAPPFHQRSPAGHES